MRVVDVAEAIAGIDEHEAMRICLDEQAVADDASERPLAAPVEQGSTKRTVGPAIEMMYTYCPYSALAVG